MTLATSRRELERWLASAAFNAYDQFRLLEIGAGECTIEVPFRVEFERLCRDAEEVRFRKGRRHASRRRSRDQAPWGFGSGHAPSDAAGGATSRSSIIAGPASGRRCTRASRRTR